MKPDKQRLIDDLLDDSMHREATLLAGARILRRRRQWRVAQRAFALAVVVTATLLWLENQKPSSTIAVASPTSQSSPKIEIQSLSDDELLALFPDTPVGLATLPDGKKRLLFPRAGDEARFITSM